MSCSEGCPSALSLPEPSALETWMKVAAPLEEWKALIDLLSRDALGVTERGLQVGRLFDRIQTVMADNSSHSLGRSAPCCL